MVLKSTSTRGNGGAKTDRSDAHPGIESSNELNGREKNSFFGFIENILERVLKYSKDRAKEPEQDSEAKKREEFMNSQYRMLNSIDNLDEVIAKRKEYGLSITPAAQDYLDFVQGRDGVTDAWQLSHRAAYSLEDQIDAEDKGNDNFLDRLYDEGKLGAFTDKKKNTKELYKDMTQEEYNTWRGKAADETREFMSKMDKKLTENPDYRPDTLNSVLEYRLYQVFKNSNIDNLRENLENQFYGELVGSNLVVPGGDMFPISTFANFQNGLIAAGLLTPKDDFINKYEAGYDLYQQNFEKYNDLKQNERLASEIAKDKELLREGKFDELLKKDHGKVLNEEIKRLQTLKTNSTLNERNKEIYEDRLNSVLRNFSGLAITNFYGGDVDKVRDVANTLAYDGLVREIRTSLSSLGRQVGKLKYNEVADDNSGFENLDEYELGKLNMQIEDFKTKIDNFIDFRKEKGLSGLEGIISPDKTLSEIFDDIKSIVYYEEHYGVSDIERGKKVDNAFRNLFMQDVVDSDYSRFTFEKLNSDFDKLYKEINKQKDLRIADEKALQFFIDIKDGVVTSKNLEKEVENRFGQELKNYDKIEWRANPLATTMLQAIGILRENLNFSRDGFKHFDEEVKMLGKQLAEEGLGIKNLSERLSLTSIIKEKDPNMKKFISLLSNGFCLAYKEQSKDIYGFAEKINNPYEREEILVEYDLDYPVQALKSLMDLVAFEREKGLIEGLENGITTLEEFANKYGDEYKKLLNDAKESLKENLLALNKGFNMTKDYKNYLAANNNIEPEKVIEAVREAGKKIIDVNPKFLDDVASGKHQELIKKLADQIKEEYPDKKNVKKLLEEVFEKGAEQTIVDKGLDGRTKEARFIKEVDKKIKEANELSM